MHLVIYIHFEKENNKDKHYISENLKSRDNLTVTWFDI